MIDLTPIIGAVIALCVAIITVFIVPYIKSKFSVSELDEITKWVQIAVQAAEQLAASGAIDADSRYDYVKNFLIDKGFSINIDEIKVLIESAVEELNQSLYAIYQEDDEDEGEEVYVPVDTSDATEDSTEIPDYVHSTEADGKIEVTY